MDKKLLGRRINTSRKNQGITGEELAELCNINPTYLRQIESGAKTPSLPMFVLICEKLQVSPSYLLADSLSGIDRDEIESFFRNATPQQIKLVRSIIKSMLNSPDSPTE